MNKYFEGRYQARQIEHWHMHGYYEVFDTEDGNKVIQSGFLSLDDAYAVAFGMNQEIKAKAERQAAILRNGLDW